MATRSQRSTSACVRRSAPSSHRRFDEPPRGAIHHEIRETGHASMSLGRWRSSGGRRSLTPTAWPRASTGRSLLCLLLRCPVRRSSPISPRPAAAVSSATAIPHDYGSGSAARTPTAPRTSRRRHEIMAWEPAAAAMGHRPAFTSHVADVCDTLRAEHDCRPRARDERASARETGRKSR